MTQAGKSVSSTIQRRSATVSQSTKVRLARLRTLGSFVVFVICILTARSGRAQDADADGTFDNSDNCVVVSNPSQLDPDLDGYGAACDGDFNQDGAVTAADQSIFLACFGDTVPPANPNCDMDGNGIVDASDFSLFQANLALGPGPSGLACAGIVPCSAEPEPVARLKVLILFEEGSRSLDQVAEVRMAVDASGGRARGVLGLAGIIADIETGSAPALTAMNGVHGLYEDNLSAPPFGDSQTVAAVAAWNRLHAGPPPPAEEQPTPPGPDVDEPPDLPPPPAARGGAERESPIHKQNRVGTRPQPLMPGGTGCDSNGAGFNDTSLYLAGNIAVGVFYLDGTSGPWSPAMTASTFAEVVYSLDQFVDIEPNARIVFTYVNEVDAGGNPLPQPEPPDERLYDNDLRNIWCTDWAYLISVTNGGVWPRAWWHGPSLRLDRTFPAFNNSVQHETGHIFGAADQYVDTGGPTIRRGYLFAVNANGWDVGGGYFAGAGERLPDLMASFDSVYGYGYNSIIGPFTAGQFGWYDSNGDGEIDVTETQPIINAASVSHTASNPTTYGGIATDRVVLNEERSYGYGHVSINRVTDVQYRINQGAWQAAVAVDGAFDSASEDFQFTTPSLPYGTYEVQIRAINTIGVATVIPYSQQLVIAGSSTMNARPFGSFAVTPARARYGTQVTADGSASSDLETPKANLQFSWNWGDGSPWTAFSASPVASHAYAAPGDYSVEMSVRDAGNLQHLVSRDVVATPYDTSPVVRFRATPENRHFTPGPGYSVFLSVAGSSDAETPYADLLVRWDADDDGVWDGDFSFAKTTSVTLPSLHYPRSDRRRVRVQVLDESFNTTTAERTIWVVPYNHRPTAPLFGRVTFAPSGSAFVATVHASDPDLSSSWDGLLEYRYDFEGDGIWDTYFEPNASITVPSMNTLRVEVIDRFRGRLLIPSIADLAGGVPTGFLTGIAHGGSIFVSVNGVHVEVTTYPGDSASTVASRVADAINSDGELADMDVSASSIINEIVVNNGTIGSLSSADPGIQIASTSEVPALSFPGGLAVTLILAAIALRRIRRG